MASVLELALPGYTADTAPDAAAIGPKIDALVQAHFAGNVALRAISLADHPGLSRHALAERILALGTDRYDPRRLPVLHAFYGPRGVELHAVPCTVLSDRLASSHAEDSVGAEIVADFYHGPPVDRGGPPLRVDLLLVYDRDRLEPIPIEYGDGPEADPCAFRFRDPQRRADALLGIVHLL